MKTINLNNPIFAFYIDVRGLSKQSIDNLLYKTKENFNYDNITTWFLIVNEPSKIECIYNPNDKIKNLINKINSIINEHKIDSPELKSLIRDFKIENILEEV